MKVSNADARDQDQQLKIEIDRLERELDVALASLVDWQDQCDRLTIERDTARRIAVACENDERRSAAEKDDAIAGLLERDVNRLLEIDSLTRRNHELELLLGSRPA